MQSKIYLGTIALEPKRWSSRTPSIDVPQWIDRATGHGFDGVELWEPHYVQASPETQSQLRERRALIAVFNTYILPEEGTEASWKRLADDCRRLGVQGLKFNFGPDEARVREYTSVLASVRSHFPSDMSFLCECHPGTVAEQPEEAHALLSVRELEDVEIICHPFLIGDSKLALWFETFGSRVQHMHVQARDADRGFIRLPDNPEYVRTQVAVLKAHGFDGTWTVEFVHGTRTSRDIPEVLFPKACDDRDFLVSILHGADSSGDA